MGLPLDLWLLSCTWSHEQCTFVACKTFFDNKSDTFLIPDFFDTESETIQKKKMMMLVMVDDNGGNADVGNDDCADSR